MSAAVAVPARDEVPSANDRFKDRLRARFWTSVITAVVFHALALIYWPAIAVQDFSTTPKELTAVELAPDIVIPPPPQAIARPATPIVGSVEVAEDLTIAPTTFESNPVVELPPPPEEVTIEEDDPAFAPGFTPFTVAPALTNPAEAARAMLASYPSTLRDVGIGGTVLMYLYIDEEGVVRDRRIHMSSGYPELDRAAAVVADVYRFSPALNMDRRVAVWVSMPMEYSVR